MKVLSMAVVGLYLGTSLINASADTEGNTYVGFGLSSLALDGERLPGVPTRSPGHTSKLGSLLFGYQFNDLWSADISLGTDISKNVDATQFSINGYRYFGSKNWKPFVSGGFSSVSIDNAQDDQTQQFQAGLGISGALTEKLELRMGYQHFFEMGGSSFNDDTVTVGLNWHFRKLRAVSKATPVQVAQPESVPAKAKVVDTIELQVQFDYDNAELKSVFKPQLEALVSAMKENPEVSITVEGHTCSLGSEKYNQGLSERRAEAIKNELVKEYGIPAKKIHTVGYGETRPIADNNTESGREKNRRAIVVILQPAKVAK